MKIFSPTNLRTAAAALLLSLASGVSATEVTLYEGATETNNYAPVWMYWADTNGTKSQMVYPADIVAPIVGQTINSLTFYPYNSSGVGEITGFNKSYNIPLKVRVGSIDRDYLATTGTSEFYDGDMTEVFNGVISASKGDLTFKINFDSPYTFTGENLIIETTITQAISGGVAHLYFFAEQTDKYCCLASHGGDPSTISKIPVMTVDYGDPEPYAAAVTPKSIDFPKTKAGMSAVHTVKVTNAGTETIPVSISGIDGTPFSAELPAASLASKESVEIPVTFAPAESGEYSATMTINCGEAGSFDVSLAGICPAIIDGMLEIADGTDQNDQIPFYMYNADTEGMGSQIIYPADELVNAIGKQLTSIKFFVANPNGYSKNWSAPVEIKLAQVSESAFATNTFLETEMTQVYSGTVSGEEGGKELLLEFSAPFVYSGGNLLFEIRLTAKGSEYLSTAFYGQTVDYNVAVSAKNTTVFETKKFLPHTIITYDDVKEYNAKVSTDNLTFKTVKVGKSQTLSLNVSNTGLKPLDMALTGLDGTAFTAESSATAIASGESATVNVTFAPTAGGETNATLTINLGDAGALEVALTGTGREVEIIPGKITSFDEDDTNGFLPLYLQYFNKAETGSQVIYPAEELTRAIGQQLTGITYYVANENGLGRDMTGDIKISIGTTDANAFASEELLDIPMVDVYEGPLELSVGDYTVSIPFSVPVIYNGGNLVVQIKTTTDGSNYVQTQFRGETSNNNCAIYFYHGYSSMTWHTQQFYPMTTFDYAESVDDAGKVLTSEIDFGTVKLGQSATESIKVANIGKNPFSVTLSGLDATVFTAEALTEPVASGTIVEIPVTFTPTEGGENEATVTVTLGEIGSFEVVLKGFCKAPVDGELEIAEDGTAMNQRVPLSLYDVDTNGMGSEIIYHADNISSMAGKQITGVKFHAAAGFTKDWSTVSAIVELGVTDETEFSVDTPALLDIPMQQVYSGPISGTVNETEFSVNFDTPYVYAGKNLVFHIQLKSAGGQWQNCDFRGETTADYVAIHTSSGSSYSAVQFIPSTTFYYEDALPYKAAVSTASIDFGTTRANKPVSMPLKIENRGTNSLNVAVSGLEGTAFSLEGVSDVLESGNAFNANVVFNPEVGGLHEATLTLDLGEAGTFEVALAGNCKAPAPGLTEITICEGNVSFMQVPILLTYLDAAGSGSQIIYPESMVEAVKGQTITSMTFYVSGDGFNHDWKAPLKMSLGTTDRTSMGGLGDDAGFLTDIELTEVFNGEYTGINGETEFTFDFTTPFEYNGGNLVIELVVTENGGSYTSGYFWGIDSDVNNAVSSMYSYGQLSYEFRSFYPMLSIVYGKEIVPGASVSATEVTFPDTKVGQTAKSVLTLTNTADRPFTLSVDGLTDTPFAAVLPAEEIAANSTVNVELSFSAATAGTASAILTVDFGDGGKFDVALTGTGVALEEGDTVEADGLTYVILSDNTVGVDNVSSELTECTVPATINIGATTYTVVSIEREAFYWSNVESVILPETVTEIKYGAFRSSALAQITLPAGLQTIGDYAFRDTKLTSIVIPDGVTVVPASAFAMCESLTSVTLPANLQKIGSGAFYKAGITSIEIPDGCTEIASEAFESCSSLASVTLPAGLTEISSMVFLGCSSLTSVEIPASVKTISETAFENSGLTALNLPASVEKIASNAFNGAPVSTITVDAANTAFIVDAGVLYSADHRFLYLFPRTVENKVYTVNEACAGIIGGAFYGSNVTEVILPEGLIGIDSFAFCKSDIETIAFPAGMSELFEQALAGTQLTEVALPESLTYVAEGLFAGCEKLTTVTLPAAITDVRNRAFYNCTALTAIHCLGETPAEFDAWETYTDPFFGVDCSKVTVYCPAEVITDYRASEWGDFFTIFDEHSGVAGVFAAGEINVTAAAGIITVDLRSVSGARVEIYNIAGSLILSASDASGVVESNSLESGCYIVKVAAGDKKLITKIAF